MTGDIPNASSKRRCTSFPDLDKPWHEHEVILYWSSEDQAFIAEEPEFPGYMEHGGDQEAALRNIKDVMQFWIERTPRSETGKDTLKQQASPLAMRLVSRRPSERT